MDWCDVDGCEAGLPSPSRCWIISSYRCMTLTIWSFLTVKCFFFNWSFVYLLIVSYLMLGQSVGKLNRPAVSQYQLKFQSNGQQSWEYGHTAGHMSVWGGTSLRLDTCSNTVWSHIATVSMRRSQHEADSPQTHVQCVWTGVFITVMSQDG